MCSSVLNQDVCGLKICLCRESILQLYQNELTDPAHLSPRFKKTSGETCSN